MAFYLLKIHKVIQIMPKMRSAENCWHAVHANVRQIARLPEQRCWQKRRNVGKLPTAPAAAQKANFRAKKNLSSRCSSRVWQDARENISQKELLVWGLSPVGFEPTADCLGGSYSIQLSYWLMCLKPGDFKVFARFQCDSYGFILVLL